MFRKIAVAYNESPEAQRALSLGVQLAKSLNAELSTITVTTPLPSYTAFAAASGPSLSHVLISDHDEFYALLENKAREFALLSGLAIQSHVVEGREVETIVGFLRSQGTDLLVVGLHPRDLYLARLWSTVYELAKESPCSVLGVH
jgi:nucleotide-binding universal stress UspA family protein